VRHGTFDWPIATPAGSYTMTYYASDPFGASSTEGSVTITVAAARRQAAGAGWRADACPSPLRPVKRSMRPGRGLFRHVALLRRNPPPPRMRPRGAAFFPPEGTNRSGPAPPGRFPIGPVGKQSTGAGRGQAPVEDRPCMLLVLALRPEAVPRGRGRTGFQGADPRGPVTRNVPFASESSGDIRSQGRYRLPQASRQADDSLSWNLCPLRSVPPENGTFDRAPPRPPLLPQTPVAILAPALDTGFRDLETRRPDEGDVVPPNAMGARGPPPRQFPEQRIRVFSKGGQNSITSPCRPSGIAWDGPGEPAEFPYDTKVLYDPPAGGSS